MSTDTPASGTAAVSLRGITKRFGDFTAVKDRDIEIERGEFFSMLGPSGSGKTTVLRMIAGFEAPTEGTIHLEGTDITHEAPFDREVNTVFQDYALFPHMNVLDNVAYGLTVRKMSKAEKYERSREALRQVQLDHLADRLPSQLSGGQRQRIALARALILRPKVLLLDEPLGALDKQLREQMQIELKQIQREAGITFIFVTHDQEEALTLSDRIAVYNDGKIEQVGSPREVYEFPQTEFVAKFLGVTNLISSDLSQQLFDSASQHSIRPERVGVRDATFTGEAGTVALQGVIAETVYAGPQTRYLIDTEAGVRLISEHQNAHAPRLDPSIRRGDRVTAVFDRAHATAIPGA
ncbi:MAG: ABC transporter ATP-binding protein [Microbacteriaceae bacterium]